MVLDCATAGRFCSFATHGTNEQHCVAISVQLPLTHSLVAEVKSQEEIAEQNTHFAYVLLARCLADLSCDALKWQIDQLSR